MLQNEDFINAVIRNKTNFQFSIRKITDDLNDWQKFKPFIKGKSEDEIYFNESITDGLKLKFRFTTVIINARY